MKAKDIVIGGEYAVRRGQYDANSRVRVEAVEIPPPPSRHAWRASARPAKKARVQYLHRVTGEPQGIPVYVTLASVRDTWERYTERAEAAEAARVRQREAAELRRQHGLRVEERVAALGQTVHFEQGVARIGVETLEAIIDAAQASVVDAFRDAVE